MAAAALAVAAASGAMAQDSPDSDDAQVNTAHSLKLPQNPQVFGAAIPSVIKATAIVNGDVITQTDVDERLTWLALANGNQIPADEVERLRQQVIAQPDRRNARDPGRQEREDRNQEIGYRPHRRARCRKRQANPRTDDRLSPVEGTSIQTMRRQIEGEIAWQRLQSAKIESGISVGDDEVKAVLDRLNASKGVEEYHVGEIFLSATPATESQILDNANKILEALHNGASFAGYARQYSEASTAAVGGDLGWVRPEQLPAALATTLREMTAGTVSSPIMVPGGVSILAVQDTRKILTADPRDAVLTLKQVSISFPKGTSRQAAEPIAAQFGAASRTIGGCGGAEKLAADFHGEVVTSDQVKLRDLPVTLQQMMLPMQVGQTTQPFGSLDEGVRVLVICGRDEVDPGQPSYDDVYNQINEERVNTRARRYLRDLRRDAVIEFR